MIGIVILNYNNSVDTINCLKSVLNYMDYPFKIIVVDNGSTKKNVVEELKDFIIGLKGNIITSKYTCNLQQINLLLLPQNIGYACGNKEGLKLLYEDSDIKYIMILNNDIIFTSNIVCKLIDSLNINEDSFIVSPLLMKKDGVSIDYTCARNNYSIKEFFYCYLFKYGDWFGINRKIYKKNHIILSHPELLKQKMIKIEMPSGSCMVGKKVDFQNIDDFDPNTFLYCEENILAKKIEKIHKSSYLIPQLSCIHMGGATTSKSPSNFIAKCSKQSIIYYMKHYSGIGTITFILFKLLVDLDYFLVCFRNSIRKHV